jgi:peptidoglycan/xylan/chitin deacetylase (PgdA/CDA1 family)
MQEPELKQKNKELIFEILEVTKKEMRNYINGNEKYLFMSWDNLIYLKNLGHTIGSHTCTHPTLSKISLNSAFEELSNSFSIIQDKLNINEISFAYPHGNIQHIGNIIPNIVKQIGYSFAVTAIPEKIDNQTNKFLISRMTFDKFLLSKK